jgi:hypothetical protein
MAIVVGTLAFSGWRALGQLGAGQIPLDEDGFTNAVAERYRRAVPEANVQVAGPLHLKGTGAGGRWDGYLDTVHSICERNPPTCEAAITQHIAALAEHARLQPAGPQRSTLRVTVRPQAYVDGLARAGTGEPLIRRLPGAFWAFTVADLPTTIQTLQTSDIVKLGLTPDAAFNIGRENMRAEMERLLTGLRDDPADAIRILSGDPYQSSLFAFPELWAPLARSLGGDLLVSIVATDQIAFTPDGPGAARALIRSAGAAAQTAQRPFPPNLFRWHDGDWVVVPIPD